MRTFLSVSASLLSLFVVACGGGSGGSGDGGGSGSTSTAGSGGTGGAAMSGGSGGTGGSVSTGGTGGNTAGSGGVGGSTGAAFGQPCTMDSDCVSGLVCFDFNAKGKLCTHTCQTDTDCEAPSSGCNGMGYCKPN